MENEKITVQQRARNLCEKVIISLGQELYSNDFKVTPNAKDLIEIAKTLNEISKPNFSSPVIIREDNNKCFNLNKRF